MISRRLTAFGITLATSLAACSLVVIGELGDSKDWGLDGGPSQSSSGSSSSGSDAGSGGACNILASPYFDDEAPRAANTCSDCINQQCLSHVTYACGDGGSGGRKPWWSHIANCAQGPFLKVGENGNQAYSCTDYTAAQPSIGSGADPDTVEERESENCIFAKCVTDAGADYVKRNEAPPCAQCVIEHDSPSTEAKPQKLDDDPCGKCLAQNCALTLSNCCGSEVMDDFVTYCAYTQNPDNLTICQQLADSDAGRTLFSNRDKDCYAQLHQCWADHCSGNPKCQ